MTRTAFAALLVLAVAAAAMACTTETTVQLPTQQAEGVTVSGEGRVFGEPDVAIVTLGVDAEAPTVAEAREEAAASMNAMLDALREGGVADEDIQTARFSVQPVYDFLEGRQELRGFSVTNIVTAKIREIDDTGALIDAAVGAGGDLARVENLVFTIDDPTELEDEARVLAMEQASEKAETLAGAAGLDLGEARSIVEGAELTPIPVDIAAAERFQAGDEDTPIETGELEVRVTVQVVYALE